MRIVHDSNEFDGWKFFWAGLPQGKSEQETAQKELFFLQALPSNTPILVILSDADCPALTTSNKTFGADMLGKRSQIVAIHIPNDVVFNDNLYSHKVTQYEQAEEERKKAKVMNA